MSIGNAWRSNPLGLSREKVLNMSVVNEKQLNLRTPKGYTASIPVTDSLEKAQEELWNSVLFDAYFGDSLKELI